MDFDDFMYGGGGEFVPRPYMFEPLADDDSTSQNSDNSDDEWTESDTDEEVEVGDPTRLQSLNWCSCTNCAIMTTPVECKCCHEYDILKKKLEGISCLTQHSGFQAICLDRDSVQVSFCEFLERNGALREKEKVHEKYIYVACRRLCFWIWHTFSNKKDIRKLPACAVTAIRRQFPPEDIADFKYVKMLPY